MTIMNLQPKNKNTSERHEEIVDVGHKINDINRIDTPEMPSLEISSDCFAARCTFVSGVMLTTHFILSICCRKIVAMS